MSKRVDNLKHIVVLMMENRSFDHMLGGLKKSNPRINGLNGNETNPDPNGNQVRVAPLADYQDQLNTFRVRFHEGTLAIGMRDASFPVDRSEHRETFKPKDASRCQSAVSLGPHQQGKPRPHDALRELPEPRFADSV